MKSSQLQVKQLLLGPMENYCYVLHDPETREATVIDPAWDVKSIRHYLQSNDLTLKSIAISHYHPDHCGGHLWGHDIEGASELLEFDDVPVFCHKLEAPGLKKITGLGDSEVSPIDHGFQLPIGRFALEMIHTPGHTPGSICFKCEQSLFSGDTLFINGCGRVDLPGGDATQLYDSLKNKLSKMPGETILFPGHAYSEQKSISMTEVTRLNPFLNLQNKEHWLKQFG